MSNRQTTKVRDVMNARFILVDGMETVHSALDRLRREAARCILVEKRDEDDEYGLVLLSDIAKKVIARDRSPDRVNVYEIMSKPVIAVSPDMDVRYTARLFDRFGLSVAPVIEDKDIVGVVTYSDIVLESLTRE